MAKLISNRYAYALFEAGLELNKLDEFKKDLEIIVHTLDMEPQIQDILSHPKISKNEKKDFVSNVFGKMVCQEMINFLYVIIDKRRESYFMSISNEFKKLFNEHENILEVTAITAVPMDKKAQDRLKVILGNKMNKTINLRNVVDKDIIGGVLLRIENKIIDGTIKGQLESMEKVIKNVSL
ncbi:ATP synthase F1 subcomplex delta subunit [Keratinibaculum paraultunense]|uniref:ATP synthase subunit delta n=1 Tax=Keratinibaculum paraultunense TaxID=1278232 RepID=A0A4R3KUR4_9FIRM|nr:F0F1 ATP synthase subunit delta [Keratinibaculum paraultunense]QQY79179.1 F0F1 ATP synthase subunit delta [Keratinibaculum paraultunense]TCS88563.1 ATP synthase F1 subcomplex delta subunit [Keratinibaculum paraultunense]